MPELIYDTLLLRSVRFIAHWDEFVGLWNTASSIEQMIGLLHVGFNVPLDGRRSRCDHLHRCYVDADRIRFYLAIADGWADPYRLLQRADDTSEDIPGATEDRTRMYPYQLRGSVARKAFDMLCLEFCAKVLPKEDVPVWQREEGNPWDKRILGTGLLPVIQHFFRNEGEEGVCVIRNLHVEYTAGKRSHLEIQVVEFLLSLINFIWYRQQETFEGWESGVDGKRQAERKKQSLLDEAKPWSIEVLSFLNELDRLRPHLLKLNESCLSKLREIALANQLRCSQYPVTEDRRVATLDEACMAGSPAAWMLKAHRLIRAEHNRLTMLRDAERKREAAEDEIRRLGAM